MKKSQNFDISDSFDLIENIFVHNLLQIKC
jgi:hypothetical protein